MNLKNKVVIVTGSSSGIGEAAALRFAKEGMRVVVNSKSNVLGGTQVVDAINNSGGMAIYVQADLTNPDEVKNLFNIVVSKWKTVDVLINNAGRTLGQPFFSASKDHWLSQFSENFLTAVLCSQEASKLMLEQGCGAIINTTSIRGFANNGREGIMAYSAAKAALINFTKTLAKELAPHVNVNAVAPGFVYTPPYDNFSEDLKKSFIDSTAIKRFIEPEEIAEGFLYLAQNRAITGEILLIDGGFTLKFA